MSVLTSGATWTSSRPPSVLTRSASVGSLPAIVVCAARPVVSTCEPVRVTRTCSALSLPLTVTVSSEPSPSPVFEARSTLAAFRAVPARLSTVMLSAPPSARTSRARCR